MQRLYAAGSLQEAHLILGRLQSAGIAARILNEHAQGGLGELPFGDTYPEIWLDDDRDLIPARRILAEIDQAAHSTAVRRCPGCREDNPENFAICWNCGRSMEP
ncbi:MAG TPA: DUF2007 domain-containing protein [Acidiferrobacterales bacterium]|jgi:hypothetical protein